MHLKIVNDGKLCVEQHKKYVKEWSSAT